MSQKLPLTGFYKCGIVIGALSFMLLVKNICEFPVSGYYTEEPSPKYDFD